MRFRNENVKTPALPKRDSWKGLRFTSLEDNNVIQMYDRTNLKATIYFSQDAGATWNSISLTGSGSTITLCTINTGDELWLKGNATRLGDTSTSSRGSYFVTSGKYNASGYLASLFNDNDTDHYIHNNCWCAIGRLFYQSKMVDASKLIIASDDSEYGWGETNSEYYTFAYSTELLDGPTIDFSDTTAGSYNLYGYDFYGCSKLRSIKVKWTSYSASLTNWMYGVAATGDFYNLGGATMPTGTSGIPSGWTVHTSLDE